MRRRFPNENGGFPAVGNRECPPAGHTMGDFFVDKSNLYHIMDFAL
jgi:hypothetical protein